MWHRFWVWFFGWWDWFWRMCELPPVQVVEEPYYTIPAALLKSVWLVQFSETRPRLLVQRLAMEDLDDYDHTGPSLHYVRLHLESMVGPLLDIQAFLRRCDPSGPPSKGEVVLTFEPQWGGKDFSVYAPALLSIGPIAQVTGESTETPAILHHVLLVCRRVSREFHKGNGYLHR